jgi:hypothetical protein
MQCKDVEIFVEQEGLAPLSEAVTPISPVAASAATTSRT